MFFNKDKFKRFASDELFRKVPVKDLNKMHGRKVEERENGNLVIRKPSAGLIGPFWLIVKPEWCDDSKQDSLF